MITRHQAAGGVVSKLRGVPSCVWRVLCCLCLFFYFFFNDAATPEISTFSLHDALPILTSMYNPAVTSTPADPPRSSLRTRRRDRKSTRLNSSHLVISYAVFCLKKK